MNLLVWLTNTFLMTYDTKKNQKLIHDTIYILIIMGISQYFEWNQNLLNFCYFIDFEFQMGNIMI